MKSSVPLERKEIIIFSFTVLFLSSLICLISFLSGNMNISILSVFTPTIVALVLTAVTRGKKGVSDLFLRQTIQKTPVKWFLFSMIGIPALVFLAVITSLRFEVLSFELRTTQLLPQLIVIILIGIGEEYGWRGFLLPRLLKKYSVFKSSMILGLIWGFWHFPAYLIGTGVPLEMNFMVFLLWVILGTLFISWIYYYSKNVLTSILVHISANVAFNYLPVLPEFTGDMEVFWIFIGYLTALIFLIYYSNKDELIKSV